MISMISLITDNGRNYSYLNFLVRCVDSIALNQSTQFQMNTHHHGADMGELDSNLCDSVFVVQFDPCLKWNICIINLTFQIDIFWMETTGCLNLKKIARFFVKIKQKQLTIICSGSWIHIANEMT